MAEKPSPSRPPLGGGRTLPPAAWLTISQTDVADCEIFKVRRRHLRHAREQREGNFYIIEAPDWVNVLALTPRQELVLVRQWRFGVGKLSWEPPGGVMDAGESPIKAGERELLEETGHAGQNARVIGKVAPNPAIQTNYTHSVLIENCAMHAPLSWDPHEELQIGTFSLAEVEEMIRNGEIFHSLALNALQFLFLHLKKPLDKSKV